MLTVKDDGFSDRDESLLKEINPALPVYRTDVWEPFDIYRKFIGKQKGEKLIASETISKENRSLSHRISVWIRMNLFVPDARAGWYPYAKKEIKKILEEHHIEAIVSIGPPHSSHLAGLHMAVRHNIPFYPVFIDPWVDIVYYRGMKRSALTVAADRYLEKKVLHKSEAAVFVTDSMRQDYIRKYDFLSGKSHIIYWGYNEENFSGRNAEKRSGGKTVILHAGNIFDYQNPEHLWIYIKQKITNGENIELRFAGSVAPGIKAALERAELTEHVSFLGFLPYHQVVGEMLSADYLLVCATEKRHVPGKLFEYMRCGNKIIAFGEDNKEVEGLLNDSGSGKLFSYTKTGADYFAEAGKGVYNPESVKQYDRKNAAGYLAELFSAAKRHAE